MRDIRDARDRNIFRNHPDDTRATMFFAGNPLFIQRSPPWVLALRTVGIDLDVTGPFLAESASFREGIFHKLKVHDFPVTHLGVDRERRGHFLARRN